LDTALVQRLSKRRLIAGGIYAFPDGFTAT
jgi:hypothetical protein